MVDAKRVYEVVNSIKMDYAKQGFSRPSKDNAEEVAAELIKRLQISTNPVPIVFILKSLGFNIYVSDMPSPYISGFILIDPELKEMHNTDRIISVSNQDDIIRQRFTLAHEFGHFMFDYNESKHEVYFDTYNVIKNDKDEEAIPSRFAAGLLMPPQLFKDDYKKLFNSRCPKTEIVEHLVNDFGVNKKSILKRYVELNLGDASRVGVQM